MVVSTVLISFLTGLTGLHIWIITEAITGSVRGFGNIEDEILALKKDLP